MHVHLECDEAIAGVTLKPFAAFHALECLNVHNSAGFCGILEPFTNLYRLRELYLARCLALQKSVRPLAGLEELLNVDVEACLGLSGGLEHLPQLPKLQYLNACDAQLDVTAFVTERQRVGGQAATEEEGGALVVGGCRVGSYGAEETPLWWAANGGQAETARQVLEGRGGRGRRGG